MSDVTKQSIRTGELCFFVTNLLLFLPQQKAKLQKMHAQMQEAHSMRQLELAKSTNIDKLVSRFEGTSYHFIWYLFGRISSALVFIIRCAI